MTEEPQTKIQLDSEPSLTTRLENLETQIVRLTNLLESQTKARRRRRTIFTLRFLLASFVFFGLFFAWFGVVLRKSQRQAQAVDELVKHGVYMTYTPRDSLMVGLLPGEISDPPRVFKRWFGHDFFRSVTNASTRFAGLKDTDKKRILQTLPLLTDLERLRIASLNLKTSELRVLSKLPELQSLDISHSGLDQGRMEWIGDSRLRWLDASHTRIGSAAMYDLGRCEELRYLNLERTAINDAGLKHLASLQSLRYLNLKRAPVSREAVQELFKAIPNCVIDWQPLRFRANGKVDVNAAARGAMRLGTWKANDPRESERAVAPSDQANAGISGVSGPSLVLGRTRFKRSYRIVDSF